jgi:hypothetical protein
MPSIDPHSVGVTVASLKVGDVTKTEAHLYVITNTDRSGVDAIRDDGRPARFLIPSGATDGFHTRIGTGCEPTREGLKQFIEMLEAS